MCRRPPAAMLWVWPLVIAVALVAPARAREARSPVVPTSAALPAPPSVERSPACQVTVPNQDVPPEQQPPDLSRYGGHGNDALWTNAWMWGEGVVPVPSSHVLPDGSLGPMKWAWYRYVPGHLAVTGRRLDATAPPLRVEFAGDYGERGFLPVGLIFPTGGCWEVTGRVGEASLTFVTRVVPPATVGTAGESSLARGGQDRSSVVGERADT